jgi:HPt (histidine-containing phosphotransfer) domain-containing protein
VEFTSLIARFGGDAELTRQLVALFIDECPQMMESVRHSVEDGCARQVQRAAHAFKGAVSNFTDGRVFETAMALEEMGREARLDAAPETLARLERELEALLETMRRIP